MMLPTHVLVGGVIGWLTSLVLPVPLESAVLVGMVGGALPDIDAVFEHRQTLHFPAVFSLLALGSGTATLLGGSPALFILFASAAAHSLMDIFGGGKEIRPWEEQDDRAVYHHLRQDWVPPRRVVYSGSWADFGLTAAAAAPLLTVFTGGPVRLLTTTALGIGLAYAVTQRRIAEHIVPREYTAGSEFFKDQVRTQAARLLPS